MQSLTIYKIINDDKVAVKLPVRVKICVQLFSKFNTPFASVLPCSSYSNPKNSIIFASNKYNQLGTHDCSDEI